MTTDRQARERAIDPGASFIVQAPAGSGKTEVLTQRFLTLLALVERPERLLAITFTRKATQEMRHRIMQRLAQARAGVTPEQPHARQAVALAARVLEQDRKQGWNLAGNPGRLRISTIDGLCAQLLSRDPVSGPGWSGVRVMDDGRPLYREAVRRLFTDLDALADGGDSGAVEARQGLVELLVHLNGDAQRLEALIADMLGRRSLWSRHLAARREDLESLLQYLQAQAVEAFESALDAAEVGEALALAVRMGFDAGSGEATSSGMLEAYHRFADLLTTQAGALRKPGSVNRALFPDMTDEGGPLLERFREIFAAWATREAARDAVERTAAFAPLDPADDEVLKPGRLLDCARMVLSLALTELDNLMAESGQADYTAITEAALRALGSETEPSEILLAADARIEHILMDEFQDTSHAQFKLIRRLTAGWTPGDGRSLFLVGDPMQSIYRFREANVGFFNEVVRLRRLGQVALEPLSLMANFRSRVELIDWFNQVFAAVFPAQAQSDSGAVTYTPVEAARTAGGGVHLHGIDDSDPAADEPGRIAEIVQAALDGPDDPTIAILVRGRKQVGPIASRLALHGIDFEAVETGQLTGRGAILDLMALTRLLVHPLDRVAAIAVLRAPWLGLPVGDIHRLLGDDANLDLRAALANVPACEAFGSFATERLQRLAAVLGHAEDMAGTVSLADRVEWCWRQLGGVACCADEAELADSDAFLGMLEELCAETTTGIIERLEETLARRFASSRPARVQIMTIHKAKGLEFDVVIVPGLDRKRPQAKSSLIAHQEFTGDDRQGGVLMAALAPSSQAATSLYRFLYRVNREREEFEDQRVLYVACTRARRQLHLVANIRAWASGEPAFPAGSFLKMLEAPFTPVAQAVLANREAGSGDAGGVEPVEEVAFPLRRLVSALPEALIPQPGADTRSAMLPDPPDREATAVGEVLHRWLELIHDHPEASWDAARIGQAAPAIRSSLARAGAPPGGLDRLTARVVGILREILEESELMGLVGAGRSHSSWSELPLYRREGMALRRYVIDLLVRGADGAMEIIDYKTSRLAQEQQTAERERKAQLGRYRELVESAGWGKVSRARIEVLEKDRGPAAPD